ncbi:unnamed protein product [Callosobruchus maculatus]|uniref:Uncharacterized protein n=1 Tax=Callosobruchus maculatus TaxID=64391 RepID=A0A653C8K9_CALMS|nr:unnamed protein product [Callosobruchus maculatus]
MSLQNDVALITSFYDNLWQLIYQENKLTENIKKLLLKSDKKRCHDILLLILQITENKSYHLPTMRWMH